MEHGRVERRPNWPEAMILLGLVAAGLAAASTYAFPETRAPGLTPAVAFQCFLLVAGMLASMVGAEAHRGETAEECEALARKSIRALLAVGLTWGVLAWLHVPFAFVPAIILARPLKRVIQAGAAWLGKP